MRKTILRDCLRIAREKLPRHPEKRYLHYTFIVQDNKIIEWATNHSANPPIHLGYSSRLEDRPAKTHSEFAAWKRAKGILQHNKPFQCVNIRLNRQSELRLSAPCECCFAFLKSLACTQCYYTTDEQTWDSLLIRCSDAA